MSDIDWQSLNSSEIFSRFLDQELKKEAAKEYNKDYEINKTREDLRLLEKKIKSSPELKKVFANIKRELLENEDYRKSSDPLFIEGVMLLDLD